MADKNRIPLASRIQAARRGWQVGYIPDTYKVFGGNVNAVDFGVTVNEDAALRFTAVYAAIKLLAENIAALPKSVKLRTDAGYEDAVKHPAFRALCVAPNDYMDVFSFWFKAVADLEGKGNFFAVIVRGKDGSLKALHPLNPEWVQILFDKGVKGYRVNCPDPAFAFLNGVYLEHEMIHVMLFSRNGLTGIDPISYNAAAIGRGIATGKFSGEFYKRGGQIKGVMETDQELGDDAYDKFMKHFAASAGNFDVPLLEYGIKYKQIGISPVAAQLIQTETLSIDDIARIFCIPPHLLAELSHATFSNIEQQNIFFGEFSLRPICKRIEVQLERKLFTDAEIGRYSVKFDLKGLMRGDAAARANYYTSGINAGWMTPNEARRLEEMKSLPGLDSPRMPMNFVQIDEDGKAVVVDNTPNNE
jgi:HK97 family phage portal protein